MLPGERRVVLVLLLTIAAIAGYTAWRVSSPAEVVPGLKEAYLLNQKFQDQTDAAWQRAKDLSNQGRHKEAAYVLVDLAGMKNALADNNAGIVVGTRVSATQPSVTELIALFEFTQASGDCRSLYKQLLRSKYPAWKTGE